MRTAKSRSAAIVALWIATAIPAAATDETSGEIRYREVWGYAVVVPVQIDGHGPFDFLLDTGTTVTVVRTDLAHRLGLRTTGPVPVVTLTGDRAAALGRVGLLQLGPAAVQDVEVVVHDMPAVRRGDRRIVGIVGQTALYDLVYTIDHRRGRIAFGPTTSRQRETRVERVAGRPVVQADLGCGEGPVRLALDSGTAGLVLYGRDQPVSVTLTEWVTAETNHGTAMLRAGRLPALCLGGTRLANVPVAIRGERASSPGMEDGLLPTSLFARVHFDGPRQMVRLEPW